MKTLPFRHTTFQFGNEDFSEILRNFFTFQTFIFSGYLLSIPSVIIRNSSTPICATFHNLYHDVTITFTLRALRRDTTHTQQERFRRGRCTLSFKNNWRVLNFKIVWNSSIGQILIDLLQEPKLLVPYGIVWLQIDVSDLKKNAVLWIYVRRSHWGKYLIRCRLEKVISNHGFGFTWKRCAFSIFY